MNLESFQKSFKNQEINIKSYITVVSILIGIIIIIMLFNNNIEDYYSTTGTVKDKEINIIVDIENLSNIVNNKKIKIEKDIFTYKVKKIEDYMTDENIYKKITIEVEKYSNLVNNNVIKIRIIINKTNIFNYIIKTLKGE